MNLALGCGTAFLRVLICAVALCWGAIRPIQADEYYRPDEPVDLPANTVRDEMVRIKEAKVAWADHAVLRRDFPTLRQKTNAEIEQWILDQFAYVSRTQLDLSDVRSAAIPADLSRTRQGFRPPDYNRAAVLEAGAGQGFVDVKGVGHPEGNAGYVASQQELARTSAGDPFKMKQLRTQGHSDGLMSLGESIAEVTRQRSAQRLFDLRNAATGSNFQTVESYFIISTPIEILKEGEQTIPAAIYGRQSHIGRVTGLKVPDDIYTDPFGKKQASSFGTAVDFGGVLIEDRRLNSNFGAFPEADSKNPQASKAWVWGHETAEAYQKRGDTKAIYRHIEEMLAPIEGDWKQLPVARALERLQNPGARGPEPKPFLDRIAALIFEGPENYRGPAFETLVGRRDRKSLAILEKALLSKTLSISQRAAVGLCKHRHPEAASIVLKYFTKDAPDWMIHAFSTNLVGRNESEWLPVLRRGLSLNTNVAMALEGWTTPESLDLFRMVMAGDDFVARSRAVDALGGRSDPASFALLERAFKDPERDVRVAAARALLKRPDREVPNLTRKWLNGPDIDVRRTLAGYLPGSKNPGVIQVLCESFNHEDGEVIWKLSSGLRLLPEEFRVEVLEAALRSKHMAARKHAMEILEFGYHDKPSLVRLMAKLALDSTYSHEKEKKFFNRVLSAYPCFTRWMLGQP
ncbi:MAG TPA: HEAT repeat domain-containing protein [Bdellovibrionota bacterium]|nr:HEAT repeat domain-containing protein [Bdellovibrionota bacterium]